ncbi:hypothetical protein LNQ81_15215 [Myroides sp. M-43]|uniref:hypothetical protein n=1 Tax=Myroides oncorhynchi TaxID=2893756 RepID=UPI001E312E6A|nr:hypothetical protein [Myroides oncorhynchi]MCC9044025.1 hypothetical protein [Myroides oncorhynchi]
MKIKDKVIDIETNAEYIIKDIIEKNKFIPEDLYKLVEVKTKKEIQVFKSTFAANFKSVTSYT